MFLEKIKERIIWSMRQVFSFKHFIGMALFIILFTCHSSQVPIEKVLMTIVFIIFCTYEQLGYAIMSAILIGVIIGVFPFLAIIIPFLIIGGIIKNLQLMWKNKYAVYLSMSVVMMPSEILEVMLGDFYRIFTMPVTAVFRALESSHFIHIISYNLGISYEIIVCGIFFNLMMISLYLMKYSVKEAFAALGMMPLLLLALIIPAVMNELSTAINTSTYDAVYNTGNNQNYNLDPGIHDVNGYYRTDAYGKTEYVKPHIRTNPDGVEFNNLSYKGKR